MKIEGKYLLMSDSDMNNLVGDNAIQELKKTDPNPLLKAFVVGHEGESTGRLVGFGNIVKTWVKSAIQFMHDKLAIGTKVFYLHNADNSQGGRESIGEIVGKSLETVKDKLSVITAVYIKPKYKDMKLDVASLEMDLKINPKTSEAEVMSIDGLALGDGSKHKPGFPGASLVAQMQYFYEENNKGGNVMTLQEIISAVNEGKYKPDDIFSRSDIEKVDFVNGLRISKERLGVSFDEKRTEWEAKMKEVDGIDKLKADHKLELEDRDIKLNKYKVKEISDPLLKVRKLDEKQLKFINEKLEKFEPKAKTDEELKTEINSQADLYLTEYDKMAEIFGVKKIDDKGKPGEGVGSSNTDLEDGENLTDPKNNELIPL